MTRRFDDCISQSSKFIGRNRKSWRQIDDVSDWPDEDPLFDEMSAQAIEVVDPIDFDDAADLKADNGILTLNGLIIDVNVLGTADADGVSVDRSGHFARHELALVKSAEVVPLLREV